MNRLVLATGLLAAWVSTATAGTLDTIKQRGTLICGVSAGFAGFSAPIALAALAFSDYLAHFFPGLHQDIATTCNSCKNGRLVKVYAASGR